MTTEAPHEPSTDARQEALVQLERAHAHMVTGRALYEGALKRCADLKIPNTKIAKVVGVSEAAIRMWLKRRYPRV